MRAQLGFFKRMSSLRRSSDSVLANRSHEIGVSHLLSRVNRAAGLWTCQYPRIDVCRRKISKIDFHFRSKAVRAAAIRTVQVSQICTECTLILYNSNTRDTSLLSTSKFAQLAVKWNRICMFLRALSNDRLAYLRKKL
jgi:hypothetical protein